MGHIWPITSTMATKDMKGIRVEQLWRYPVKSLKGEGLQSALLTCDGVDGDRVVHVAGTRGPLTGRSRHGLLTLPATTGRDGVPMIAGYRWDSTNAAEAVRRVAGAGARLVADTAPDRFDILNLLVATDGAVRRLGEDVRRLRPNLVLSGVPPNSPRLPGQALVIGDVFVGLHSLRQRCVVTTIDPDTGAQDLDVLRRIRRVFGGELALNSWIIRPGLVRVGDAVRVVPTSEVPRHVGGWIVGAPYSHAAG